MPHEADITASLCGACTTLAAGRASGFAGNHLFVAELAESVAVLHEHQCLAGWCVLLLKEHAEHLWSLPVARQARLFDDVARVAQAVRHVCLPRRINYECLGNVMAHVHWHVVPRYTAPTDPDPAAPVWVQPREFLQCGHQTDRAADLAARLRAAL
ncbi:MAG: HIT family protein [Phycisphaerales bacterium]